MFRTALVVGASSGIGEQIVLKLAARGCKVAAIARRQELLDALVEKSSGQVIAHTHDVTDYDAAPALFDELVSELGGLDVIIYCAGVMPSVDEGEYNFAKDRAMLEVNLVGAVCWLDLAAAHMESKRAGTIVGISSVAGDRGRRGAPVYTASKAGMSAYLEALRNRCHRYGVQVVTVKPGPVRTPMTEGMELPFMIDATEAADGVLALAQSGTGEGYVPKIWWPIMSIIKAVPSFIFRKTNV
ncbi:MAG: SDR family NAD(P)-dependent oxidoreductase [Proteobacteria bacterium]|nr:SDR family NAD(P)-dependent oxidoreductase [Pseudomonadota bacterium]MCP4919765.1 SDR family NAD(P)-dependent oxidoreductase [Pseudomonadota bacterium]